MRRWNGWGDEAVEYPVPEAARLFLQAQLGLGRQGVGVTLAEALKSVPDARLPAHPLIHFEREPRLRHARGQSLPDWVALNYGRIEAFPDGVAYPESEEQVRALLEAAAAWGAMVIPYGGGTSVVGHINPLVGERPVLTIDLTRMRRLLRLDRASLLAEFEVGVVGSDLETQLNAQGFTLGHFPQSFEYSTLGGWIATRSSGQQSLYYGRIEQLFAGGHIITPVGDLDLPPLPASAAGPDLRALILGSEGRLGVITRATLRIRPLPEAESFYGVFFKEWEAGVETVRELVQSGCSLSMLRLSDPLETRLSLLLSGNERLVALAERGLNALGYHAGRCLLIFGTTGNLQDVRRGRAQVRSAARRFGGLFTGELAGKSWRKTRFLAPYLRNSLWQLGYAIDTLETAVPWAQVLPTRQAIQEAIRSSLEGFGEAALVFSHLSHVYRDGASIYTTVIFRLTADSEETLSRWRAFKHAASLAIVENGGTISHQHGVGSDHAPYLVHEKGRLGLAMIEGVRRALDPQDMMNPGKW